MTSLSLAPPGAIYTIKWNMCTEDNAVITTELGLCPGKDLLLINRYFGSVIVRVEDKKIALSKEIAARIKV